MVQASKRIPAAPPGFDHDRFFAGVYWHQRWQIFDGIYTPGKNPIDQMCADLELPEDLSGKRVLDIGAWNGCLSFECERRGAREVIALGPESPEVTGFSRLREALGSTRTHYLPGSAYDLNPEKLGYFDVVLFCGVLYHLRYPLLGIDNIRRVCTGEVFVETLVSDVQVLLHEPKGLRKVLLRQLSPPLAKGSLWQFFRGDELHQDPSNWFAPNALAVQEAFASAGFDMQILKTDGRATLRGRIRHGVPEFLTIGSGEGVYYDTLVSHLFGKDRLYLGSRSEQSLAAALASPEYFEQHCRSIPAWLASLYPRLLGRSATSSEMNAHQRPQLDGDSAYRQVVVSSLLASQEYRYRLIEGYYTKFLSRVPSAEEKQNWLWVFVRGGTDESLLAGLFGSEEYYARQGGTPAPWLNQVYVELLGRNRDAGSEGFVDVLNRNLLTRAQVIDHVLESAEYRQGFARALAHWCSGQPNGGAVSVPVLQVLFQQSRAEGGIAA
jgi:tRNA (mo5U34)-methyltransferase